MRPLFFGVDQESHALLSTQCILPTVARSMWTVHDRLDLSLALVNVVNHNTTDTVVNVLQ